MLKLRSIGLSDYSVLEGRQRIGRIRLATERMPCIWIWNIQVHLTGGLPMGSAKDIDTAKAEFKAAWEALKARTTPEQLAAAYKAMNIRDDGCFGQLWCAAYHPILRTVTRMSLSSSPVSTPVSGSCGVRTSTARPPSSWETSPDWGQRKLGISPALALPWPGHG